MQGRPATHRQEAGMRKRLVLIAALAGLAAAALASFSFAAPRQAGQKVAVTLKEYKFLGAPAKLKPGATEFTFANKGKFAAVGAAPAGLARGPARCAPERSAKAEIVAHACSCATSVASSIVTRSSSLSS